MQEKFMVFHEHFFLALLKGYPCLSFASHCPAGATTTRFQCGGADIPNNVVCGLNAIAPGTC